MTAFTKDHNIAWIDVETSGLEAHRDALLEVACIVTDAKLNVLDEVGYHAVIWHSNAEVSELMKASSDFVIKMHTDTGLWAKLSHGKIISQVEHELHSYLAGFGAPKTMPLGGNSVALDQNFLKVHLPKVHNHLDYHMRDVSTIAGLAFDWFDLPWFQKKSDHTAMTDIKESIRELKHYRDTVFRSTTKSRFPETRKDKYETLGDVASELDRMKNDGMTRDSIEYALSRVFE